MGLNIIIKTEIVIIILLLLLYYLSFINNKLFLLFIKNVLCKFRLIDRKSEILKNLWLGDYTMSQDISFIKKNNIKFILNISTDLSFLKMEKSYKIKKMRIPINDDGSLLSNEILLNNFEKIYGIIKKYIENNKGVYIHCSQGVQRSPAFVVLFLKKYKNISNKKAIEFIKTKRPSIFYNGCNFKRCLSL